MKKRYPKRVNPETMITRFQEIFKSVGLKKPSFRNLLFVLIAISVAKTFRMNEIASCLPILVARGKSKQKRLLRLWLALYQLREGSNTLPKVLQYKQEKKLFRHYRYQTHSHGYLEYSVSHLIFHRYIL